MIPSGCFSGKLEGSGRDLPVLGELEGTRSGVKGRPIKEGFRQLVSVASGLCHVFPALHSLSKVHQRWRQKCFINRKMWCLSSVGMRAVEAPNTCCPRASSTLGFGIPSTSASPTPNLWHADCPGLAIYSLPSHQPFLRVFYIAT